MPWLKAELSVQQLQTSRQQQQQKCPTVPSHRFLLNINTFARLMAISTKIENEHANARPIEQALLSICYFVWHFEWINNNTWKIKFKKTHREHSPIDLISIFGTDFFVVGFSLVSLSPHFSTIHHSFCVPISNRMAMIQQKNIVQFALASHFYFILNRVTVFTRWNITLFNRWCVVLGLSAIFDANNRFDWIHFYESGRHHREP